MTWNQPICADCYAEDFPGREPVKLSDADPETCCLCGTETIDGIYIRANPALVAYPSEDS